MFGALTIILLAAISVYASARNPVVLSPKNGTYNAGDEMVIQWSGATTGFINIDLVNTFSEVLQSPVTIALGVPAADNKYVWKVPPSLRTAAGYQVRTWGTTPPKPGEESALGHSGMFTVFNNIPQAINAFKVLSPSGKRPCAISKPCEITWDYPDTINGPAYVHLRLFKAGSPNPLYEIADVPAAQKSYLWNVPNDPALVNGGLYVSVSGAGTPPAGPGFSNEMGGNGQPFEMAKEWPAAGAWGNSNNNAGNVEGEFKEQAVSGTETVTVLETTGTTTVMVTITESNAAGVALRSSVAASYAVLLVVPLLVLLF